MTGLDVLAAVYPTVAWEQIAPGRWRGRGGITGWVVLAVVDGGEQRTTWMSEERPEMEAQAWQKLQSRLDATKHPDRAWLAASAADGAS